MKSEPQSAAHAKGLSRARRGSQASDSQVAYAVREGRMVEFLLPSGPRRGYIINTDDYHWVVADRDSLGVVHLVHKTAPCLTIHPGGLDEEPVDVRNHLEPMLRALRGYVEREHFSQSRPS